MLAAGCRDGTVTVLEVATVRRRQHLEGTGGVAALDFSPDGHRIAVASADRAIRIWDADTGRLVHTLRGHVRVVTGVGFSPDGRRLVSGSQDGSLRVWQAESGLPLVIFTEPGETTALAVAPDGSAVAGVGPAGVINVRWGKPGSEP
jgi:WD40 repeat protein